MVKAESDGVLEKQMLNKILRSDKDFPGGPGEKQLQRRKSLQPRKLFHLAENKIQRRRCVGSTEGGKGEVLMNADFLSHVAVIVFSISKVTLSWLSSTPSSKAF